MENEINKDKSITHECNVLTNILNPAKSATLKYDHYSPILQGCMNTCSGRQSLETLKLYYTEEEAQQL